MTWWQLVLAGTAISVGMSAGAAFYRYAKRYLLTALVLRHINRDNCMRCYLAAGAGCDPDVFCVKSARRVRAIRSS